MSRAPGLALALGLAALLSGADGLAAAPRKPPPAGEAERAAGQKAFDAGHFQDAAAHLEKAWELSQKPALLFTLGQCHRQLGNWEMAAFFYGRYLALAPRPIANEPAARALLSEMQLKADVEKRQKPQIEVAQPVVPEPTATVPPSALPAQPPPVPAPPAEASQGGLHTRWWFWTAIGGAVVAGAVTTAVLATQRSLPPTTLGQGQW